MSELISIQNTTNLVRDLNNNGIVNTNCYDYTNYIKQKTRKETEKTRLENIENEIKCLKNDLSEIKKLLMDFHK